MVGLVISDTFLLSGVWSHDGDSPTLGKIVRIPYTESIATLLHDEVELNSVLASALRQAKENNSFDSENIVVGIPDSFVDHSVIKNERDLSRNDLLDYIHWVEAQKGISPSQSSSIYGQIYQPNETNIHVCNVPKSLIRTLKLSITEMGGNPYWMGPLSSLYLDGSGMSEASIIERVGNKYNFMKVQNNRFDMGILTFSSGIPKVVSTTDVSEDITLAALGLEKSELDDIPVFCPQKLGRQATSVWELSDFRMSIPFYDLDIDDPDIAGLPNYEANIMSQLITSIAIEHSFNFFDEPDIIDFFFTKVIPKLEIEEELENSDLVNEEKVLEPVLDKPYEERSQNITGIAIAILLIVGAFIGLNYIKLQDQLNDSFFGVESEFDITREETKGESVDIEGKSKVSSSLLHQSKAISSSILTLLTQTDLNKYNSLTITKSFLSLEYLSGINPNIENLLEIDPTSFSVEATGKDSTVFLWYYSFDLPINNGEQAAGSLTKIDLMTQLDTTLSDYSLKYFEQVFTKNQIYGPLLIWVRGKADILQASAIISNVNDNVLLRKFVLFNESDHPNPRAGFYVSILED